MRNPKRPIVRGFVIVEFVLVVSAIGTWKSLGIRPAFYSRIDSVSPEIRRAEARRFWAQSTQLGTISPTSRTGTPCFPTRK